jgi:hypothetical protein
MELTLLYFDDCPNWQTMADRLDTVADEVHLEVIRRAVTTVEEAEAVGFLGSPTLLVDGRDPFAEGDEPAGLSCRMYQTPDGPAGSPTVDQLRAVLTSAGASEAS